MAIVTSNDYEFNGPKVNMFVDEGVFTADSSNKFGGDFASPITASGVAVKLVTGRDLTVIKCTGSDKPIGWVYGIPNGGDGTRYSRVSAVELMGAYVKEVEVNSASTAIAVGAHVAFSAAGGTFGQGQFSVSTESNGTVALQAYATASGAGQRILVLFGASANLSY